MTDEKLPLHDEAEARRDWRGEHETEAPDADERRPGVDKGLVTRPPD